MREEKRREEREERERIERKERERERGWMQQQLNQRGVSAGRCFYIVVFVDS